MGFVGYAISYGFLAISASQLINFAFKNLWSFLTCVIDSR